MYDRSGIDEHDAEILLQPGGALEVYSRAIVRCCNGIPAEISTWQAFEAAVLEAYRMSTGNRIYKLPPSRYQGWAICNDGYVTAAGRLIIVSHGQDDSTLPERVAWVNMVRRRAEAALIIGPCLRGKQAIKLRDDLQGHSLEEAARMALSCGLFQDEHKPADDMTAALYVAARELWLHHIHPEVPPVTVVPERMAPSQELPAPTEQAEEQPRPRKRAKKQEMDA